MTFLHSFVPGILAPIGKLPGQGKAENHVIAAGPRLQGVDERRQAAAVGRPAEQVRIVTLDEALLRFAAGGEKQVSVCVSSACNHFPSVARYPRSRSVDQVGTVYTVS